MVIVDPSIRIESARLLLRPLRMEDAADVTIMRSHPEVMKHTPTLPSDDIEKAKAWIQNCFDNENGWNFAIELLPTANNPPRTSLDPCVIGMVGMVREQEVGYMFNAEYWGKGYATEALKAFMPAFFDHYSGGSERKFEYAEAHTDPELVASHNVLQKAGFKLYEKREKDFENPVLGWRDTLVYRLYRSGSAPQDATNGTA